MARRSHGYSRSQALPGNALRSRLCLGSRRNWSHKRDADGLGWLILSRRDFKCQELLPSYRGQQIAFHWSKVTSTKLSESTIRVFALSMNRGNQPFIRSRFSWTARIVRRRNGCFKNLRMENMHVTHRSFRPLVFSKTTLTGKVTQFRFSVGISGTARSDPVHSSFAVERSRVKREEDQEDTVIDQN